MHVIGYYLELSLGGKSYENSQQNSVCVSFGGPTEQKSQATSLNSSHLTTVRPHNSPVKFSRPKQRHDSLSLCHLLLVCDFSVSWTNERTFKQVLREKRNMKWEFRVPNRQRPHSFHETPSLSYVRYFMVVQNILSIQLLICTPSLQGRGYATAINEAKERILKDDMSNTLGLPLRIPLPTFLRTEWLRDLKGIQGSMMEGWEGVTAPGTCCNASTGLPSVPNSWNK